MVSDFLKARLHQGAPPDLYFWRDHLGLEVDLLVEVGGRLNPVEIKSAQTIATDFFSSLRKWADLAGRPEQPSWLVYGGGQELRNQSVTVVPWQRLPTLEEAFRPEV